jgi:putative oxidoreductase
MALLKQISCALTMSTRYSNALAPLFTLLVRLYIARVFFSAGLVKFNSWSGTLLLFKHEYNVPLLPYEIAAYVRTAAELVLPVFIALGLGARLPALALFAVNLVAAYSYPYLWTDGGWCAMKDHVYWGILIAYFCVHGPGKLSLDYLLVKKET